MEKQVWLVALTPAQRWVLLNLSHAQTEKIAAKDSKAYRRFTRAFGFTEIRAALRDHGKIEPAMATSEEPSLFELTAENIDYALGVAARVARSPIEEDTVGDLFDLLEDLKAGRDYTPPELARYDAAAEDWAPPSEDADEETAPNGLGEPPPGTEAKALT